jgi:hypothetical protein
MPTASLFGIANSNRDFSQKDEWGKNKFNTSFPVALVCWLGHKRLQLKYLKLKNRTIKHSFLSHSDFLGLPYNNSSLHFEFESIFTPYQQFVFDHLPRIDLVTMNDRNCMKGIEIKLTALPDDSTSDLPENQYGSEIVVRPDTIVYLALSIISETSKSYLKRILSPLSRIKDWSDGEYILSYIPTMKELLLRIMDDNEDRQSPLILQPIWKTISKSHAFADNAFDVFVWSNFATTQLFVPIADSENRITRYMRSLVWIIKMLFDYANNGRFNHKLVIDELSFNTKNDKAFATGGSKTQPLMNSPELVNPRIPKTDIKHIILGEGYKMLSPERRLDAVILSNLELFQ